MIRRLAIIAGLGALALSGCEDPYEPGRTGRDDGVATPERSPALGADSANAPAGDGEVPGTVPSELRAPEPTRFPGAGHAPRQTLALAARLYGNWTSETAPERFQRIAAISVGEARAQLRQVAAEARADPQQGGARSSATTVAIQVNGGGRRRRAVIVTRERVMGEGIPDEGARYRVTLADVERHGDRWVIAKWTPQP